MLRNLDQKLTGAILGQDRNEKLGNLKYESHDFFICLNHLDFILE